MKTLRHYFTILFLAALGSTTFGQAPVIDGQNCSSGSIEWSEAAVAVDYNDQGGIPGTSDFNRLWAKTVGDTMYFAFTRALSVTGDAAFAVHFNTDCDASTGDLDHGGADKALFIAISSNSITNNTLYEWTSSAGGRYQATSTTFNAGIGDSTCNASAYNFFEFAIGMNAFVDPCDMGSCGSVGMTNATSYSGQSFNSALQDTLVINASLFINDRPVIIMGPEPTEICSGNTLDLDASASTFNTNGTNSADSMVSIIWDLDYTGTMDNDHSGPTLSQLYTQPSDSAIHHIAVMATDAFGCTDTSEFDVTVFANPTVTANYTIDDNFNQCQLYVWEYDIVASSDYAGNPLTDFSWDFPDGGTATGTSPSHIYTACFWTIIGDKTAYVTGTDNKGCYTTVSMEEPLPVDMVAFTAERSNGKVNLNWSTASEINNSHFELQRMVEGEEAMTIGEIQGAGTTFEMMHYSFVDFNPSQTAVYYRLKQIDYDGKYEYTEWVAVNSATEVSFNMYPNPARSTLNISIDSRKESQLNIFSLSGALVLSQQINQESSINLNELPSGFYIVQVSNEDGVNSMKLQKH